MITINDETTNDLHDQIKQLLDPENPALLAGFTRIKRGLSQEAKRELRKLERQYTKRLQILDAQA